MGEKKSIENTDKRERHQKEIRPEMRENSERSDREREQRVIRQRKLTKAEKEIRQKMQTYFCTDTLHILF